MPGPRALVLLLVASVTACIPINPEGPVPTARTSSIGEPFELAGASFIAIRHVAWSVGTGEQPFRELRLEAGDGQESPTVPCPGMPPLTEVRILPDDDTLVAPIISARDCDSRRLDLLDACAAGCQGGATVVLQYGAPPPEFVHPATQPLVITLSGRVLYGVAGGVELRSDPLPGQDAAPANQTTGIVELPFDVGPAAPDVRLQLVLRVPGAALQAPLGGLYGTMRVWVRPVDLLGGYEPDRRLTIGALGPYTPDEGGASSDVDWLRQCSPSVDCEIPMTLDVHTPGAAMASAGNAAQRDFYRWAVKVTLIALDGRSLSPNALDLRAP
jgi:hypothetical protein